MTVETHQEDLSQTNACGMRQNNSHLPKAQLFNVMCLSEAHLTSSLELNFKGTTNNDVH